MKSPITPSSIRKAAVLVVSLRRATADKLLAQMPRRLAERIRDAVATLGDVEPDEQRAVIEEFQEIGPFSPRRSATESRRVYGAAVHRSMDHAARPKRVP